MLISTQLPPSTCAQSPAARNPVESEGCCGRAPPAAQAARMPLAPGSRPALTAPGSGADVMTVLAYPAPVALPNSSLPDAVLADLRTDQAGEAGAVRIYQGILAVSRDPALRAFALRHLATEQSHLQSIEAWLPRAQDSRLLPLWRAAGWVTGALPALLGPRAVYCTVEAIERFVDLHYAQQIEHLASQPELAPLRQMLIACQGDEVAHRIEAESARGLPPGLVMRIWLWLVDAGSRAAVAVCRYF